MTWTFSVQSLLTICAVIAQAGITWWRVLSCEKEIDAIHVRLTSVEATIGGLREWRAEMKAWRWERDEDRRHSHESDSES